MSFPTPSLDDRKFQDIVDEAKRLIPKYCPEWTNHNVSDPGVALIELFAWMTEMILYRVNRVPDRFYTKFLDLVGIEPYPATAATADLTFWLSATDLPPVTIPAETQVTTLATAQRPSITFMTDQELVIAQPELIAVQAATAAGTHVDQWDELQYDRGVVKVFPSTPLRVGDTTYFGFTESLAGNVIRCDIEASIEGLGIDPSHPPLAWQVWSGEQWIPCTTHRDETGGLNRSGAVTLLVPLAHKQLTIGPTRAFWLRVVLVNAEEGQPTYQASPGIRSMSVVSLGGTVPARHGRPAAQESVGVSDGSPDQRFRCRNNPVHPRRPGESLWVATADGFDEWVEVDDFTDSGPEDHHFMWNSQSGEIKFGPRITYANGTARQYGAIPPEGSEIVVTGYRFGGGSVGNVGSNTITSLSRTIPFIDSVTNLRPALGGVDAETIANAKVRGPLALRTGNRAVTAGDYEHLAKQAAPHVARARALHPAEPAGPIRLLIVPKVTQEPSLLQLNDLAISDELVKEIGDHLEDRRMLGTSIEVGTPFYQGVSVVARVVAAPGPPPDLVRQRILDTLYEHVNPISGGPNADGWPFDMGLNVGAIFQRLVSVPGVDRVEEVLLFEADALTRERKGRGKERITIEPNSLFISVNHQVVVQ